MTLPVDLSEVPIPSFTETWLRMDHDDPECPPYFDCAGSFYLEGDHFECRGCAWTHPYVELETIPTPDIIAALHILIVRQRVAARLAGKGREPLS